MLVLLFQLSLQAFSQVNVDDIVKKANLAAYYQGDDGKAHVKMIITDNQGREREREFVILKKDKVEGGDQYYYVYFSFPADVRKMSFMVWKHPGKDDDRWLYLPALDLVKRIAASDKRSSFVGSDFLYEDVSGRGTEEDDHEFIEENDEFYVLKNMPKNPGSVEFDFYKVWIDKTTFIPKKAEYYDKNGKLSRIVEALKIEDVGGYPTILKSKITNLDTGSSTVLDFTNVEYNLGFTENIFTERYLRRPPKEAKN
jgi:hypothetical protein